jgi:hypothetical protein
VGNANPHKSRGTLEYFKTDEVFRHFRAFSNEIVFPKLLICPTDVRRPAIDFVSLRNSNISYFIGVDATESFPSTVLTGDRNITNGVIHTNGILEITSNSIVGWTEKMHNRQGNIGLSDGSVQHVSTEKLRQHVAESGVATNRLAFPLD